MSLTAIKTKEDYTCHNGHKNISGVAFVYSWLPNGRFCSRGAAKFYVGESNKEEKEEVVVETLLDKTIRTGVVPSPQEIKNEMSIQASGIRELAPEVTAISTKRPPLRIKLDS